MTWTVILSATLASFYREHRDGSLDLLRTIEHPSGRARGHELVSDRQGRSAKGTGRRVVYEPRTDPTDVDRDNFLAEVVALLVAEVNAGECKRIVLIAPPRLLGRLRARLPDSLANRLVESFPLDLGRRKSSNIPAAIRAARAHGDNVVPISISGVASWPQSLQR